MGFLNRNYNYFLCLKNLLNNVYLLSSMARRSLKNLLLIVLRPRLVNKNNTFEQKVRFEVLLTRGKNYHLFAEGRVFSQERCDYRPECCKGSEKLVSAPSNDYWWDSHRNLAPYFFPGMWTWWNMFALFLTKKYLILHF